MSVNVNFEVSSFFKKMTPVFTDVPGAEKRVSMNSFLSTNTFFAISACIPFVGPYVAPARFVYGTILAGLGAIEVINRIAVENFQTKSIQDKIVFCLQNGVTILLAQGIEHILCSKFMSYELFGLIFNAVYQFIIRPKVPFLFKTEPTVDPNSWNKLKGRLEKHSLIKIFKQQIKELQTLALNGG